MCRSSDLFTFQKSIQLKFQQQIYHKKYTTTNMLLEFQEFPKISIINMKT